MGYAAYESARSALAVQSGFWTGLIGLLALLALAAALGPALLSRGGVGSETAASWRGRTALALGVALWAGWARLALYHLEIWRVVRIPDIMAGGMLSGAGQTAGPVNGLAVPLWIEGEKLYAWACLLAIGLLLLWRRRHDAIFAWTLGVLGVLTLGSLWATNPFAVPLPDLHKELTRYFATIGGADAQLAARALESMWARQTFFYNTAYMWTHPPSLFVSYAAFVVSFIACILLLATRAVRYDRISYAYAKFGYLILTAGMLMGYPWAIMAWDGDPWWWSGKVNMSLMMWVLYSAYLHSRLYLNRRGMWRFAAWLGVICFATLVMTYLSTYLIPGAHAVAQP